MPCKECGQSTPEGLQICPDCEGVPAVYSPIDDSEIREQAIEIHQGARSAAPPKTPVTHSIIVINVLVYLVMVAMGAGFISFEGKTLVRFGAQFGFSVSEGQWWRLFTSNYLHAGLLHIAMNMYVFYDIGRMVERIVGRWAFIIIYTISGITGSAVSLYFNPTTVSIGASGAIFGIAGCFFACILTAGQRIPLATKKSIRKSMGRFIIINIAIGVCIPIIDNSAHVGGLIAGFICGLVLYGLLFVPEPSHLKRIGRLLLPIVLVMGTTYGSYTCLEGRISDTLGFDFRTHDDLVKYIQFQSFGLAEDLEYKAANAYTTAAQTVKSPQEFVMIMRREVLSNAKLSIEHLRGLSPETAEVRAFHAQKVELAEALHAAYINSLKAYSTPTLKDTSQADMQVKLAFERRKAYQRAFSALVEKYKLKHDDSE